MTDGPKPTDHARSSFPPMSRAHQHLDLDALDRALGNTIRLRRSALHMSQTKLADAAGVSFQQIQKYERGVNRVSFSCLVAISQGLGCRVADLVGEPDGAADPNG
jgi:DNA-binding Xre family transcriptional regulator